MDRARVSFDDEPILRLSLDAIRWGDVCVGPAITMFTGVENRAECEVALGITEVFTARHGGLELELRLDRPLATGCELRVEASLETQGGGVFDPPLWGDSVAMSPATARPELRCETAEGRAVRLGPMTVIDATGRKLGRFDPRVTEHLACSGGSGERARVVFALPAAVLADAVFPVRLDPDLTPEYPVSDRLYQEGAPGEQLAADVAVITSTTSASGTALVVWEDYRGHNSDIYGARISYSSGLLDPAGIRISTATGDQTAPAVTALVSNHESEFLVVWVDRRNGNADIYGAHVSTGGVLADGPADTGGIPISTATDDQLHPSVDGLNLGPSYVFAQALVVWEDGRSGQVEIRGTRMSGATVTDGPPETGGIMVTPALGNLKTPCVTPISGRTQHVVVYVGDANGNVYATFVDKNGVMVGQSLILGGSNKAANPSVAGGGLQFFAAWEEHWAYPRPFKHLWHSRHVELVDERLGQDGDEPLRRERRSALPRRRLGRERVPGGMGIPLERLRIRDPGHRNPHGWNDLRPRPVDRRDQRRKAECRGWDDGRAWDVREFLGAELPGLGRQHRP